MRALRSSLVLLCFAAIPAPVRAASGPTPAMVRVVGWPWIMSTRTRVTRALLAMRHTKRGVLQIRFQVSAAGRISAVRAEGPPGDVPKVVAAVRSVGQVAPPPDHRSHRVAVQLRIR